MSIDPRIISRIALLIFPTVSSYFPPFFIQTGIKLRLDAIIILGLCILLGTLAEALPRTDPQEDIGTFTNPGVARRPRYRYW